MPNTPREIGLFIPATVGYFGDVIAGVQEFARSKGDWVIEVCPTLDITIASTRTWTPHGILVNSSDGNWPSLLRKLSAPTVQVGGPEIPNIPRVTTDNYAIGQMAAGHFLERAFKQFAFCGYESLDWSRQRESGYRDGIAAAGHDCISFLGVMGEIYAGAITGALAEWIRSLPKPIAIFAAHDRAAMLLANVCAYLRTRVPEDVAILGVDNSLLEIGFASPPVSSIMGSARRVGYEAAVILDGLMNGQRAPRGSVLVPPAGVAVRQSTDVLAIDDPDIIAALRFIRENASTDIEVSDVADAVLVSRRALERKFKTLLNRTPGSEILRSHIAHAKMLLVTTDTSVLDVALQSGFPSASKFSAVFRREVGITPTNFRRLYGMHGTTSARKNP